MPILLTELFNTVYPYKLSQTLSDWRRVFTFNTESGILYSVTFDKGDFKDSEMATETSKEFIYQLSKDYNIEDDSILIWVSFFKHIGKNDWDKTHHISPTEGAVKIFSTVIDICKKELGNSNHLISFSAKEPSRVKLYDALVRKLKRPGDTVREFVEKDGYKYYLLIPKSYVKRTTV